MEENRNAALKWKVLAIVAIILLITVGSLYAISLQGGGKASSEGTKSLPSSGDPLSLWTDGAESKKQMIDYMTAITSEGGADYIPPERRIAVFDLDGTLFGETNPIYFDHSLLLYRVLQDESYKDKASDFEKETAYKILEGIREDKYPEGMDMMHGQAVASAFSGMTVDEFVDYCKEFRKEAAPGYDGLLREDMFYKPMLQIIDYLESNDFKVYVVSGTDRLILRGIVEDKLDLPFSQVIGSDETIVASGQGDTDGLEYVFTDKDDLVLGGDFVIKNLKMNKVWVIAQEIGEQPVLSFGNSTGDSSMAEYVTSDNEYRSLAFMLCCDDTEREYGNEKKAEKMQGLCSEFGWVPVSMKNDWKTIYGDGVKKNPDNGLSFYYETEK